MIEENEWPADLIKPVGNRRIIEMLSELRMEDQSAQAQVEIENTVEGDAQEPQLGPEKTISQPEKSMQDQVESLVNRMKHDILNKLDEVKAELSLEIKSIIKSQEDPGNQVQILSESASLLNQNSTRKNSIEGFYSDAVKNQFYPVVVDHVTCKINSVKKKIPQNILDQYPELPAALVTTSGPISTLFETYSFLKDIPGVKPEEKAKGQILMVLKGMRKFDETFQYFEYQEPKAPQSAFEDPKATIPPKVVTPPQAATLPQPTAPLPVKSSFSFDATTPLSFVCPVDIKRK